MLSIRVIEGKVKCTRIGNENYGKKAYMENKDIKSVREMFRTRFGMMPFAGNYSRDRRFARTESHWFQIPNFDHKDF